MGNTLSLSNNLNEIELEIRWHKENAGRSIWEIGRRLNHVKEKDLVHGEFGKWLEKIDIEQRTANRFMKVAKEIPYSTPVSNLGYSVLYLIASLPEEQRKVELEKAEQGESSTKRELEELQRRNREQEKRIKELENQKSEIVEKEVVKKVVPHDYEGLKSDIQQLELSNRQYRKKIESAEKRNEFIEAQYNELLEQRKEVNEKSKKYDELNEAIQDMQGKMDEGQKQIKAQKDVYELVRKTNDLIVEVAPLTYLIDAENVLKNEYAQKPIRKIITSLRDMADRLESSVEQDILEGEIINE